MEYVPSNDLVKEFFDGRPPRIRWFKGRGCAKCNHTGYNGRTAVAELWTPSDQDIILINKGAGIDELRRSSHGSTIFMAEDAMQKLAQGKTNLEELIRTLPHSSVVAFRHFVDSVGMKTATA
jgi:type IV pilus assembly protein PilB